MDGNGRIGVQMGRMPLLVQLTSMLPWGQPEPPEMTLLILKDGGAEEASSAWGAASARSGSESATKDFIVTTVCGVLSFW